MNCDFALMLLNSTNLKYIAEYYYLDLNPFPQKNVIGNIQYPASFSKRKAFVINFLYFIINPGKYSSRNRYKIKNLTDV